VFRPAYSDLGERLRIHLPSSTSCTAYSVSMPQDVIDLVMKTCRMDSAYTVKLLFTTNRPNLVYATIPMIGSIDNFANLHILLPSTFIPGCLFHKAIKFLDNKLKAASLARYMNSSLPPDLAKKEPFRQSHSGMSKPL
jgi:superfamily II DNA helicase RecQ